MISIITKIKLSLPICPPLHPYDMQFKNPQQAVVSAVLKGVYFYP